MHLKIRKLNGTLQTHMTSWNKTPNWMGFFNSPKVIYVYFTRLVVATAISISCLTLKKKKKVVLCIN